MKSKIIKLLGSAASIAFLLALVTLLEIQTSFLSEHPFIKSHFAYLRHITPPINHLHYFQNKNISLDAISIRALYLVSEDAQDTIAPNWEKDFDSLLRQAAAFHNVQFGGSSALSFYVVPKPVVAPSSVIQALPHGLDSGHVLDLSELDDFLHATVFNTSSPLYDGQFARVPEGVFPVTVVFTESSGTLGGNFIQDQGDNSIKEGIVLFNRGLLVDPEVNYGSTLFYHEFAHALGIPDGYSYLGNQVSPDDMLSADGTQYSSDDIMGAGRYRSLEINYLSDAIKKRMLEIQ